MSDPVPRLSVVVLLSLGLAACQPATGTISPSAAASLPVQSNAPSSTESSPPPEASASALAGQTDTDWGRIWDALPDGFPTYPGSTPAEAAASGPASAVQAVEGADARTIAGWMQSKLEQASYSTEALTGPFEDGSYVLESTGSVPGCRVKISIAPLGGLTTVTVLYGASCPKP